MSLLDDLEALIKAKQKVNKTTLGLLTKANKPTPKSREHTSKAQEYEQSAIKLHDLAHRIRAQDVWRHHSVWIHTLHTHCVCGKSYSAPQGMLLRQLHRDNGSARYIPLTTLEGLLDFPLKELHRQERIPACNACIGERVQGHAYHNFAQLSFDLV